MLLAADVATVLAAQVGVAAEKGVDQFVDVVGLGIFRTSWLDLFTDFEPATRASARALLVRLSAPY